MIGWATLATVASFFCGIRGANLNESLDVAVGGENLTDLLRKFAENYPVEVWKGVGFYTDDYAKEINVHWLRFSPPGRGHFYALAVLYIFIMTVGSFGNLLVVLLYLRCKSLRTPANTLVVNLALSDLLMMCMMPIFIYNCFHFGPALGKIGCKFYGFLGGISGTVSICILSAISLDRYYVIKYPLNRAPANIRVKICLLVSWLYGATFSIIPVLDVGLGSYVPEGYLVSCSYDYLSPDPNVKYFILSFFMAAWSVPFVVIVCSYVNIIYVVIVARNLAKNNSLFNQSSRHVKRETKQKQEIKLAAIVFLVISLWFVAWTPYAIVSLLGISGRADLIPPLASMIPALFCKTASCVDPYIYALTHPRFKAELRSVFCKGAGLKDISRIWSMTDRSTRTYVNTDNEDIAEEIVMIELKDVHRASARKGLERESDALAMRATSKPSWWARPSFSNTSNLSNIRRFASSLSTKDEFS